jgi:DNA-binding GntR family transcriptional regulator
MRRAYDHVKRRLLEGAYAEGQLLSEGVIASELGISRTPVREACLQLEAEGLLKLYPKRGALVVPIGPREIRELFEAREVIERHALAHLHDPAALAERLDDLIDRQRAIAATPSPDRVAFAEADRELHRTWVEAADNAILLSVYDGLRDRQQRVAAVMIADGATPMAALADEHAAIVDALRRGDLAAADRLLAIHLDSARERSGAAPGRTTRVGVRTDPGRSDD